MMAFPKNENQNADKMAFFKWYFEPPKFIQIDNVIYATHSKTHLAYFAISISNQNRISNFFLFFCLSNK